METATVSQVDNEYSVKINNETYSTLFNVLQAENGGSYNNYAISNVYVEEGYRMTLEKTSDEEDQLKTFNLLGDDLEGFRQKVLNYNRNGHSFFADESKGNLRF